MVALDAELHLQGFDKGPEHVQHQALGVWAGDHLADFIVHQGDEDDGPLALALGRFIDLALDIPGLVNAVDEGPPHMPGCGGKLRQDGIAEGLGRDAGAVGDKENSACGHGSILTVGNVRNHRHYSLQST